MASARPTETYVSVLRRRLGSARELIATVPGGYRLDPGCVSVDLDEFDRLVQLGVTGVPAERFVHLCAAVELSREPVLTDEPYAERAMPVREQYAGRHRLALALDTSAAWPAASSRRPPDTPRGRWAPIR